MFKKIFFWRGFLRKGQGSAVFGTIMILVIGFVIYVTLHPQGAGASWADESWAYREVVPVTSTNGSTQFNVFVSFTLDTQTLISNSKLQSSCQDIRITDSAGNFLPYHVGRTNACNATNTTIDFLPKSLMDGKSTFYVYYGNPSALSKDQGAFSQSQASNYSIGTLGSEENAPQPIAYWKMDEGYGTTTSDATTNKNTATLANMDSAPSTRSGWMTEDSCVSGKCIKFSGQAVGIPGSSLTVSNTVNNVKTVAFWVRPASSSAALIDLNASDASITASSGTISATNFTSPTIYVNGVVSSTLTANQWNLVEVTTGTGITASAIKIGNVKGDYLNGFMDEIKFYNYVRSASQVQVDYNSRGNSGPGGADIFGVSTQNMPSVLSNGLVGYWKMNESTWLNDCSSGVVVDSSGIGNNGKACPSSTGPTGGAAGKFSYGGSFDGVNDYVDVANQSPFDWESTHPITLSAWIKTSTNASMSIISKMDHTTSDRGYEIQTGGSGRIYFQIINTYASNGIEVFATDNYSDNNWHHIVATYDGSGSSNGVKIYFDGVLQSTSASFSNLTATVRNSVDVQIGARYNSSQLFTGSIDEARIYNRVLSPDDVSKLYNWSPGPVGYWNFEDGNGSTVNDTSANSNTGTWNGTLGAQWTTGKFGKGGNFNGTNNYVSIASTIANVQSVSFWVNPTSTTANLLDLDGGTHYITSSAGTVSATGFSSPSIYVNGALNGTITANTWNYITITTATGISSSAITIGKANGSFTQEKIDEVRVYNYIRAPGQIVQDMNGGHPLGGSPVGSSVAYYKFDEGYGTTANNSGSDGANSPGTLTNMATGNSLSGWTLNGRFNKAVGFDGSNDYVSIANNPTSLKITADLSISAWVYLTTNNAVHDIVAKKGASGQFGYRLSTTTSGAVQFEISNSGSDTYAATSSATLSTNQWYHVAGVYNSSGSITVYVNGQQSAQVTSAIPSSIFNSSANVNIGAENAGGSNFMKGYIDEVKIYSGAITPNDIRVDYNRGSSKVLGAMSDTSGLTGGSVASNSAAVEYCIPGDTSTCTSPVGRWDFEEGTSTTANDSSASGNSGTWNGTLGTQGVLGKIGKAGNFNGSNYVSVPNNSVFQQTAMTFEFWFNPASTFNSSAPMSQGLLESDNGACKYWSIYLEKSSGKLGMAFGNGGCNTQQLQSTTTSWTAGTWYHIVITFGDGHKKLYVNGALQSTTADSAYSGGSGSMDIGHAYVQEDLTTRNFTGKMDSVRIFNYVRSASQIEYDYNRLAPVAWWRFDECQGTTINDVTGGGLNGTLTIGATGTYTSPGTCFTSSASSAWYNGASGRFNYSMAYDGTDDYTEIPTSATLNIATAATFSSWVKNTASPSSHSMEIMSRADSGNSANGFTQYILSTGYAGCDIGGGVSLLATVHGTKYKVNDGNWHNVVCTWNTGTLYLYVDGKLDASGAISSSWSFGANVFRIGKSTDTFWDVYVGQIDDVKVFNYLFNATQARQLYNQSSAVRYGPSSGAP